MAIHIDIEDSTSETPGLFINVELGGVNLPSDADIVAMANDILGSDVIQHVGWGGIPVINNITRDSSTTLYTAP